MQREMFVRRLRTELSSSALYSRRDSCSGEASGHRPVGCMAPAVPTARREGTWLHVDDGTSGCFPHPCDREAIAMGQLHHVQEAFADELCMNTFDGGE